LSYVGAKQLPGYSTPALWDYTKGQVARQYSKSLTGFHLSVNALGQNMTLKIEISGKSMPQLPFLGGQVASSGNSAGLAGGI
jgi:hypothetical protein